MRFIGFFDLAWRHHRMRFALKLRQVIKADQLGKQSSKPSRKAGFSGSIDNPGLVNNKSGEHTLALRFELLVN